MTIVGARPQFVKAAAVSRAIAEHAQLQETIVHTGQHFDDNMSKVFFDEMSIPVPHFNLDIHSLNHGAMTGRMLEELEKLIISEQPAILMVYGDTNSTLAGALAARKLQIPVAHVEAGLRSFEMRMPEEVNRILTDRISSLLFCPTAQAITNLEREGFANFDSKIVRTGDVMYDAALFYSAKAEAKSKVMQSETLTANKFVLATIHRQENTDDPANLQSIISGLNKVNEHLKVIMPVHPRTRKMLMSQKLQPEFMLIDPVGYFDMIQLLRNCTMVVTDSGGLQKEAFFFNKFCITVREQTEWVELVECGCNELAGANGQRIVEIFNTMLGRKFEVQEPLYGHGDAGSIIARELAEY